RHDHNRSNVTIAWSCNNAYTAQGFVIERSTDGTNFRPLATVDTSTTSFTDEKLPGGTYFYRVESFNDIGLSRPGNVDGVLIGGGDFGIRIDQSAGFASHGNLTRNGAASFAPDPIPVGTFLGHHDIGNVARSGNATFAGGTYTLNASGGDIWDNH